MDTTVQVGFAAKLFVAGGTSTFPTTVSSITYVGAASAPSFTEVPIIGNVTLNLTTSETNVSVRGVNGWELMEPGAKIASIDIEMPVVRGDAKREAFFNSWLNRTLMGIAVLDGPISSVLSKGFAADMKVVSATQDEPVTGSITQKFTLKPCFPGADTNGTLTAPTVVFGSTGGTLTIQSAF